MEQQAVAFNAILTKEVLRFARIWVQTILPAGITMALYFVIFGNLIGSRIGTISGISYIDYIVPGIILMAVINNAYANVVSSFYSAKFQKHVEEMLVSPMPNYLIVLGFMAGGMARGFAVGVVVVGVAMFFTDLSVHSVPVSIAVVILTSMLFSLAGLINAVFANSFDDISIIPTFVLTPLTYLGGVFYSIDMLPDFWRAVSLANPILYMVNAFRYGMLGETDTSLLLAFGIIILFVVALFLVALQLLRKGVGIRT
ncbi:MAG: ABC transporter permease [Pseudomonadota bacterium]|nr:MAG: ABC transporter permease [Pseudomonadota bacterium]